MQSRSTQAWLLSGLLAYDACAFHAGLDRNNYDRSACESYFQAYKECKKREVG